MTRNRLPWILLYIWILVLFLIEGKSLAAVVYYQVPKSGNFEEISEALYGSKNFAKLLQDLNQKIGPIVASGKSVKYFPIQYVVQSEDTLNWISYISLGTQKNRREILQINSVKKHQLIVGNVLQIPRLMRKNMGLRIAEYQQWRKAKGYSATEIVFLLPAPSEVAFQARQLASIDSDSQVTDKTSDVFQLSVSDWNALFNKEEQGIEMGFKLAKMNLERGHIVKTSNIFSALHQIYPKSDQIYFGEGQFFEDIKQEDKAITAYKKAIELNPKYVAPYISLIRLFERNAQNEEAKTFASRLVEVNPQLKSLPQVQKWLE